MAYQAIQMPTTQGAGIADALRTMREDQRQRQLDVFNQMIQQGQADRQQQAQDMKMDSERRRLQQEETDRLVKVQEHVTALHNKGLGHEAQQFARLHGLTGAQNPNPVQDPGAAPVAPEPGFVGPIDTPEHAQELAQQQHVLANPDFADEGTTEAAGMDAIEEVQRQQAERDAFANFPAARLKHEAQSQQFQDAAANPTFTYSGGGQAFTVDPRERFMAAREEQKRRGASMIEALGKQPGADRIGAEVSAGREPEQAFDDQSRRELFGMGTERALDVAATKAASKGKGEGKKGKKMTLQTEKLYDDLLRPVFQNMGYKDIVATDRKWSDIANQISGAKDNAALKAIGAGSFVKLAQGGTGVISDADMEFFWNKIGGLGMRAEEAFASYTNGKLSPDKEKVVSEALKFLSNKAKERVNTFGKLIELKLANVEGGPERTDMYLELYAPGYKASKDGAAKPEAQAPKAPAPSNQPAELHLPSGRVLKLGTDGKYH